MKKLLARNTSSAVLAVVATTGMTSAALVAGTAPAAVAGPVCDYTRLVCGRVFNQTGGTTVRVTLQWTDASNSYRSVSYNPPNQRTVGGMSSIGGFGVDVDGYKVPSRCRFYVTDNNLNGRWVGPGWYKINDATTTTVYEVRCEA